MLVANFCHTKYVLLHYENIQLYLRLGLKFKKIHQVLEFNESLWLKSYNEFNTQETIEAEKNGDKNGKSLYKLMDNVVYGKAMENVRNRIDARLVSKEDDYLKWTSKPAYMSQKIFDNDSVAIRKNKVTLRLNKPACAGMCILDLSKVLTYEFHYDYIKNKSGNKSRLSFTDTDSLMCEIKAEDFCEDFKKEKYI